MTVAILAQAVWAQGMCQGFEQQRSLSISDHKASPSDFLFILSRRCRPRKEHGSNVYVGANRTQQHSSIVIIVVVGFLWCA